VLEVIDNPDEDGYWEIGRHPQVIAILSPGITFLRAAANNVP